jgi:processive 1,2-diacylglycerol beta-glucosyltransferase
MKNSPRRILIATVTVGAGHVQAARAMEETWEARFPHDQVQYCDVLDYTSRLFQKTYREGYVHLVNHAPEVFSRFFQKTDDAALIRKMTDKRRLLAELSAKTFLRFVEQFNADAIVCTHFLPLEAAGALAHAKKIPKRTLVAGIVTDFEAHALWIEPRTDIMFVASELTKSRLVVRGVSSERIHVTGIPVSTRFAALPDPAHLRKKLKLHPQRRTLLILGGGFGIGPVQEMVMAIDRLSLPLQVLVVAGKNEKLKRQLERVRYRQPVTVFGFVSNMEELMCASDLIMTKPGGLTSSEALALGKPLLIFSPIPGQETANSDYLLENGAASKLNHTDDIAFKINHMLDPQRLADYSRNAKNLGRPRAALKICETISKALA